MSFFNPIDQNGALLDGQTSIASSIASVQVDTTSIIADTTSIIADTIVIDGQAISGMLGTTDSLAYKVDVVETFLLSYERWISAASSPDGETHVADTITDNQTPFQADAGNDTWGSWVQVLGSDDTPIDSGNVKYSISRILVTLTEHTGLVYMLQLASGDSGALGLSAGTYTEIAMYAAGGIGNVRIGIRSLANSRLNIGEKCWARVWAIGQDTSTFDFYLGVKEYVG